MNKIIFSILLLLFSVNVQSKDIVIAVAANFTLPMEKIAILFKEKTGDNLTISYGSSGKFYTQIKNDAPFEVFLSADQEYPKKLADEKLAKKESQFTYAIGKLVLWSPNKGLVDATADILQKPQFAHLAMANPKLAPYGSAAKSVLIKKNLWEKLESKLVYGENITQTLQFVITGNAEIGFVAYSQVKNEIDNNKGSSWIVPNNLYDALLQDAILLNKGLSNPSAQKFLDFLKTDQVKKIISEFGYESNDQHQSAK